MKFHKNSWQKVDKTSQLRFIAPNYGNKPATPNNAYFTEQSQREIDLVDTKIGTSRHEFLRRIEAFLTVSFIRSGAVGTN